MAHSIQTFRGKNVSFSDLDLIVVMSFAADIIARRQRSGALSEVAQRWHEGLRLYGPGCIDLELDRLAGSPEQVSELMAVLVLLLEELASNGGAIPAAVLNERVQVPGVVFRDYKVSFIADAARSLMELLL